MIRSTLRLTIIAALGVTLAGAAVSTGMANSAAGGVQCGIATSQEGGMLALEGTLLTPVAASGEYRFAIRSASGGGSSNISQGGYFTAEANKATALGKVLINAGSSYDISLDVVANGQRLDCSGEIASLR